MVISILLTLTGCNAKTSNMHITPDDKLFLSIAEENLQGIEDAVSAGASLDAFDWTYSKTITGHIFSEKNPLFYAAKYSSDRVFGALLKNGANPNSMSSVLGTKMPTLIYTVWNNEYIKTRLLLEHGATANLTYINTDVIDQLFLIGGRPGTESESIAILKLLTEYECSIDEANITKAVKHTADSSGYKLELLRQLFKFSNPEAYQNTDKLLVAFLTDDDSAVKSLLHDKYMSKSPALLSKVAAAFGDLIDVQHMQSIGYQFDSESLVAAALYENTDVFWYLVKQNIQLDAKNAAMIPTIALNGNADILYQILVMSPLFQGEKLQYSGTTIMEESSEHHLYAIEIMASCIQSGNMDSVQTTRSHFEGYLFTESDLYNALSAGMYQIASYIIDNSEIALSDSITELCGTKYEIAEFVLNNWDHKNMKQLSVDIGISAAKCGKTNILDLIRYNTLEKAEQETIARAAIKYGQTSALKYLYLNGLLSDLLLLDASRYPSDTIFMLVFENTANINVTDKDHGRTALHWSILSGYKEYAEFLIAEGANELIKDQSGKTSRDYMNLAGWAT